MTKISMCFALYVFIIVSTLIQASTAASFSCVSGGSEGSVSMDAHYDLSNPTAMTESLAIGRGEILSTGRVEGLGYNSIDRTAVNGLSALEGSISTNGALASSSSVYASSRLLGYAQAVSALGMAEASVIGQDESGWASQRSAVLQGSLASAQAVSVGESGVASSQAYSAAGSLCYATGEAKMGEERVRTTSGTNGQGIIAGSISSAALDSASATGSFLARGIDSKVYSASEAVLGQSSSYSYLSSNQSLKSSATSIAGDVVRSDQSLAASGDVLVYARSITGDEEDGFLSESSEANGEISAYSGAVSFDLIGIGAHSRIMDMGELWRHAQVQSLRPT